MPLRDERGQAMAEYTIVLALVALAVMGAYLVLGEKVSMLIDGTRAAF